MPFLYIDSFTFFFHSPHVIRPLGIQMLVRQRVGSYHRWGGQENNDSAIPNTGRSSSRKRTRTQKFMDGQGQEMMVQEELRRQSAAVKKSKTGATGVRFKPFSVNENRQFEQGCTLHGWGNWHLVKTSLSLRTETECNHHADMLEEKYPEVKDRLIEEYKEAWLKPQALTAPFQQAEVFKDTAALSQQKVPVKPTPTGSGEEMLTNPLKSSRTKEFAWKTREASEEATKPTSFRAVRKSARRAQTEKNQADKEVLLKSQNLTAPQVEIPAKPPLTDKKKESLMSICKSQGEEVNMSKNATLPKQPTKCPPNSGEERLANAKKSGRTREFVRKTREAAEKASKPTSSTVMGKSARRAQTQVNQVDEESLFKSQDFPGSIQQVVSAKFTLPDMEERLPNFHTFQHEEVNVSKDITALPQQEVPAKPPLTDNGGERLMNAQKPGRTKVTRETKESTHEARKHTSPRAVRESARCPQTKKQFEEEVLLKSQVLTASIQQVEVPAKPPVTDEKEGSLPNSCNTQNEAVTTALSQQEVPAKPSHTDSGEERSTHAQTLDRTKAMWDKREAADEASTHTSFRAIGKSARSAQTKKNQVNEEALLKSQNLTASIHQVEVPAKPPVNDEREGSLPNSRKLQNEDANASIITLPKQKMSAKAPLTNCEEERSTYTKKYGGDVASTHTVEKPARSAQTKKNQVDQEVLHKSQHLTAPIQQVAKPPLTNAVDTSLPNSCKLQNENVNVSKCMTALPQQEVPAKPPHTDSGEERSTHAQKLGRTKAERGAAEEVSITTSSRAVIKSALSAQTKKTQSNTDNPEKDIRDTGGAGLPESDNELKNNMSRSEKKNDVCDSSVSEQRKEDLNDASVSMTASNARKTGDKTFIMAEPVEPQDVRADNDFLDSESAGAVSEVAIENNHVEMTQELDKTAKHATESAKANWNQSKTGNDVSKTDTLARQKENIKATVDCCKRGTYKSGVLERGSAPLEEDKNTRRPKRQSAINARKVLKASLENELKSDNELNSDNDFNDDFELNSAGSKSPSLQTPTVVEWLEGLPRDASENYVEESAWRFHNPAFPESSAEQLTPLRHHSILQQAPVPAEKLTPLPHASSLPKLPTTEFCKWTYDEKSRVLLANFRPYSVIHGEIKIVPEDEGFLFRMMERDDITVISEGLADAMDSSLWTPEFISGFIGADYYHKFRKFEMITKPVTERDSAGEQSVEHLVEKEGWYSMKVSDYFEYRK